MKKDPIREALRKLPRRSARRDFTAVVLERIDRPRTRAIAPWLWLAAASSAVGIGLWLSGGSGGEGREIAKIEAERRLLEQELDDLRSLVVLEPLVFHLGRDERTDLVLDLSRISGERRRLDSKPASYSSPAPESP